MPWDRRVCLRCLAKVHARCLVPTCLSLPTPRFGVYGVFRLNVDPVCRGLHVPGASRCL